MVHLLELADEQFFCNMGIHSPGHLTKFLELRVFCI